MTFGSFTLNKMLPRGLLTCLLIPVPIQAADLDAAALIERLEKPAPASIDFKEFRFSALLERPLVVSGTLKYLSADHLERLVKEPYRERTVVKGESVRVERDGEKLRTFALKRAPELRGLLSAFAALLTGDSDAVQQRFEVTATEEGDAWQLKLVPRDARSREHIEEIIVTGLEDAPTCLFMGKGGNTQSVMLFDEHAQHSFDSVVSAEHFLALCRSASATR